MTLSRLESILAYAVISALVLGVCVVVAWRAWDGRPVLAPASLLSVVSPANLAVWACRRRQS